MSDANLMADAKYIARSIIAKYGLCEGYKQARKCLAEAETRLAQCYWLRVCLVLEEENEGADLVAVEHVAGVPNRFRLKVTI